MSAFRNTSHQWARISLGAGPAPTPAVRPCEVTQERAAKAHGATESGSPWLCAMSVEAPCAMSVEAPAGMPTVAHAPGQWDGQCGEHAGSPTGVWGMPSPSGAPVAATQTGPGPWAPPTSWSWTAACPSSQSASNGAVAAQRQTNATHTTHTAPRTATGASPAYWPAHDQHDQQQQQQTAGMHEDEGMRMRGTGPSRGVIRAAGTGTGAVSEAPPPKRLRVARVQVR